MHPRMSAIFLSLLSFVRYTTPPSVDKSEWTRLNCLLKQRLAPLHFEIGRCTDPEDLGKLGDQLSVEVANFCIENKELFEEELKSTSKAFVPHDNRTIAQLETLKKHLRKEAFREGANPEKKKEFHNCLKAISELKKREKHLNDIKTGAFQEQKFHKNKFKFAKEVSNGTFGEDNIQPTFSKTKGNEFYPATYSVPRQINLPDLHWFPPLPPLVSQFDNSPFKPKDVRNILSKCNKKSAPGPDGVSYSVLSQLDSCHHILATLFTKVHEYGAPPPSWGESVVKLIYKKGDPSDPTNFRMIALSGCIGKTYHLLLNARLTDFLLKNNFIDPTMQKAFLPGINGCIEHNAALDEIIKDARNKKRTLHDTFFDLADAFGSVPHSLISETLKRNSLPPNIVTYFENCYSNCKAVVDTPKWRSDIFTFNRGVFQGDPLSPVIFLMVFNPVLLHLKSLEEKFGYKLHTDTADISHITLPYADDFCLITTHKTSHQNIINAIHSNISSMGMRLKPGKCRSFSVCGGRSTDIPFYIGDFQIPSIKDEEQKFLGRVLSFSGKSKDTFDLLKDTLKEALERIDGLLVRPEYKLWILKNYLLPSKRFLLTVHTLPVSLLSKLDTYVDQYVKRWAGLPKCATNVVIHSKQAMDIPTISALYTEAHNSSHARTRLQGDARINHVIDHALVREAQYSRLQCITTQCEATYREVLDLNTVEGIVPQFTGSRAPQLQGSFNRDILKKVRDTVRASEQDRLQEHASSLQVQGSFLALAAREKEDILWKSTMFDLKAGTLKFLLNASIDTLPTPANLMRWKKSPSDLCKLCRCRGTTNHILNGCKVSLESGKYLWRHNNVVNYIVTNVDTEKYTVYSDIPGMEAPGGGTLPPNICITNLKPDIVIVDEVSKEVHIFELTCPSGPANIEKRHLEKTQKYSTFLTDCTGYDSSVDLF